MQPERLSRMLVSMGGGVNIGLTRGAVLDVGYKFAHVYYSEGLNVNRVYVGLGWLF